MHILMLHLSDSLRLWEYAHPVNIITLVLIVAAFVGAMKLVVRFANVLLIVALFVFVTHHYFGWFVR